MAEIVREVGTDWPEGLLKALAKTVIETVLDEGDIGASGIRHVRLVVICEWADHRRHFRISLMSTRPACPRTPVSSITDRLVEVTQTW